MNKRDFMKIKVLKNLDFKGLKEGDLFLCGENMIKQREEKKEGDIISYYKIEKLSPNGKTSYIPIMEKLTKIGV